MFGLEMPSAKGRPKRAINAMLLKEIGCPKKGPPKCKPKKDLFI